MDFDQMRTGARSLAFCLLVVGAAACGGDGATGPGSDDPFDPEQSSQEFGAIEQAIQANADLEADLVHVSDALEMVPTASWIFGPADLSVESPLVRGVRTRPLSFRSSAQPLIPADLLGTTFEWDDVGGQYVQTERAGAPATGVRFILYDRTQAPPVENGFLDIIDESDPSADRLNVHVEKDGITRLDYDAEVSETTSGLTISVAGFLTDGASRIDFDVLEAVTQTIDGFQVDVSYSMSLAGESLGVEFDYVVDFGTTLTLDLTATFVNGFNTLVFDLSQNGEGAIEGTVEWNGDLVMTIVDDGTGQPTFLGPEGEELTPAEAQALEQMFEIALEGLDFLVAYLVFLGGSVA